MRILLLSTYELGHQPLHVAGPAGALRAAGHEVAAIDLTLDPLDATLVAWAEAVAVSVPMHTAMRIARGAIAEVRVSAPTLPVALYGLYALAGAASVPDLDVAIAGEYEAPLVAWADSLAERPARSERVAGGRVDGDLGDEPSSGGRSSGRVVLELARTRSALPARDVLPPLARYSHLVTGTTSVLAGYVEASRGCAHRCRHCPVPTVYDGRTRVVHVDTVVADVGAQVDAGIGHLTFGDPDFLNGPHHAQRVVDAVHGAFPHLTFDVTAKVEHILRHRNLWPGLAAAGCRFVVSAFESASEEVLRRLAKGHTVADEREAVGVLRAAGIEPRPSLLPFTPWTSGPDLLDLLDLVARCDLAGNVDPVQYSIRLLVPPGSLLLQGDDLVGVLDGYDEERLGWQWHAAAPLDALQAELAALAEAAGADGRPAHDVYREVRLAVCRALGSGTATAPDPDPALRSSIPPGERPRLSEPWFCCAEPTARQLGPLTPPTLDRQLAGRAP